MTWLLDTCVLSDFARGEPGTLARLKSASPSSLAVSAITVMEVEYGLARAPARARRVAPVMQALLDAFTILPYAAQDARASAALRAALEAKGRPIGAYDILIAGTALSHGCALVTANVEEFARIAGLRVENWRAG